MQMTPSVRQPATSNQLSVTANKDIPLISVPLALAHHPN